MNLEEVNSTIVGTQSPDINIRQCVLIIINLANGDVMKRFIN
jgi:hypothetical protein